MGLGIFLLGALAGAGALYYYYNIYLKKKNENNNNNNGYLDKFKVLNDFPEVDSDSDVPTVVLFKSENCGACKDFTKEWKKAISLLSKCEMKPNCVVIDVDHMSEKARTVANENNLKTIPSVLVLKPKSDAQKTKKWDGEQLYHEIESILKESN